MKFKDLADKIDIPKLEEAHGIRIVYVTLVGSHLYGTDTQASDTDIKGIYIPNMLDVLLKRDKLFMNLDSNKSNRKNDSSDVDLHLISIHQFFRLVAKGETGALDLLFSMWREDTILYEHKWFTDKVKANKHSLFGKELKAFCGYAIGQARQSGIRGTRYAELKQLIVALITARAEGKIEDTVYIDKYLPLLKSIVKGKKYLKFTELGSSSTRSGKREYFTVLDKNYCIKSTTVERLLVLLTEMESKYGNRVKAATGGLNYKSLSHAVRVLMEVIEILTTGHLRFPLDGADLLSSIKAGKENERGMINFIDTTIQVVDDLMNTTTAVADEPDETVIANILLDCYNTGV